MSQRIEVEIVDLSHDGVGVAKADGFTLFIPGALIGETVVCEVVKKNKNFGNARLIEIIKSSPHRVKPRCDIFNICGGCDIMHLDYPMQLEFKKKMAKETLSRLGNLDIEVEEIIGMDEPYYYRNKIQVPFRMKNNKTIAGYYKKRTHDIIEFDYCYIQPEYFTDIVRLIRNLANEYKIRGYDENKGTGCIRHVLLRNNYKNEIMIVFITNQEKIPHIDKIIEKLTDKYPQIVSIIQNINLRKTNVILGDKHRMLFGQEFLMDSINDLKFMLSYNSFFQVNLKQTEKLYKKVLEYLKPNKNDVIIDGYCGVGTISLTLAKEAKKVYGIEFVEDAIKAASNNAKLNGITNVDFIVGRVEDEIEKLLNKNISAICLDPPRKGVDQIVLDKILSANIKKIVYVSCNVATLARDLKLLSNEYYIKKVSCVDMFCHTAGVECIALLERK